MLCAPDQGAGLPSRVGYLPDGRREPGELVIPESTLEEGIGIPVEHTDIEVGDNRVVNFPTYLAIWR